MTLRMSCSSLRKINKFRHSIEIYNEPVKNTIVLEKFIAQNLTCNRFSQQIPIQWLKVNVSLFSVILSKFKYKVKSRLNFNYRMERDTSAKFTRTKLRLF